MNDQGGTRESRVEGLGPSGRAQLEPGFRRSPPDARLDLSPKQRAWRRFRRNRLAAGSALFLFAAGLLVLMWPMFRKPGIAAHVPRAMTWSPTALSEEQFQFPTGEHWFGTDVHGRDLQSRVFYGARVSLLVGVVGSAISLVIGALWGALAGYIGGRTDSLLMRVVDILYSLPNIVFVIVLLATIEKPLQGWLEGHSVNISARVLLIVVGLGAISWLTMA